MNNTIVESVALVQALIPHLGAIADVDVVVCPPFLALGAAVDCARGSGIQIYAQNMAEHDHGAYTGEVSGSMLAELEIDGVILGHSERRQMYGETDRALRKKVIRALECGLTPILCVGETERERERGDTERTLRRQVKEGLSEVPKDRLHQVVIAYEPIWAIGTGITASPDQAQEAVAFVRALVNDFDHAAGAQVRVLYGGSMKAVNVADLIAQPDVDGGLVGGASLDADSFAAIVDGVRANSVARS